MSAILIMRERELVCRVHDGRYSRRLQRNPYPSKGGEMFGLGFLAKGAFTIGKKLHSVTTW